MQFGVTFYVGKMSTVVDDSVKLSSDKSDSEPSGSPSLKESAEELARPARSPPSLDESPVDTVPLKASTNF